MKYHLTLRSISPIAVSAMPGTGFQSVSPGFIPGSTLRGALAQQYLVENGEVDTCFNQLFVDGVVLYPNLYPAQEEGEEVAVVPATARSCKRFQGFGSSASEHGVSDLLVATIAMAVGKNPGPMRALENCRKEGCTQPLARCDKEFYRRLPRGREEPKGQLYEASRVAKRLIARVGIDSHTGTASPGILYSHEVINEGQLFSGDIICTQETSDLLCNFLKPGMTIYAGQARSRGLGLMEVVSLILRPDCCDTAGGIVERISIFNKVLSEFIEINCKAYISLDLQSDTIIQDAFMRCLDYIPPAELAGSLGLPGDSLELAWSASELTPVRGWNSAHRMPKSGDFAIRRGSVFLYRYDGDAGVLSQGLKCLEEWGIGSRRPEGFGRVTICSPFHWEVLYK